MSGVVILQLNESAKLEFYQWTNWTNLMNCLFVTYSYSPDLTNTLQHNLTPVMTWYQWQCRITDR